VVKWRKEQIRVCGKIRAKRSWAATVDAADVRMAANDDETVALRVMANLPLIVFDGGERMVLPMRWGFPDPKDWRRPRPIHARAETIDTIPAFAAAFCDGQRGIVLAESFNEAPESGDQHIVTPAGPIGLAFVWRRFDVGGETLFACVMVTVPANRLLAGLPTDRMPAVLAPEDWAVWLGETPAGLDAVKACLRTMDDVRWTMTREERAASTRRARPAVSDPGGLF
jgi:putative SOS response-associated peptidase YedK